MVPSSHCVLVSHALDFPKKNIVHLHFKHLVSLQGSWSRADEDDKPIVGGDP